MLSPELELELEQRLDDENEDLGSLDRLEEEEDDGKLDGSAGDQEV